jgi:hypothetical protein
MKYMFWCCDFFLSPWHIEEEVFYGIFVYMFKERKTLDDTLMTWKKMEKINVNWVKM